MQVSQKVVVVTGAARGIGRALSERFAREGARAVILSDIETGQTDKVAEQLTRDSGITAESVACNVAVESEVKALVEGTLARHGQIDLFCANAGIARSGGVEADAEDWNAVMQTNFMAHVYSSRAVLPSMLERGSGYLLHVASAAGLLTSLGSASYAASKHAALGLAEWLAIAHHAQGIRVSCLCPMGVFTDMIESDDPAVRMLHESAITTTQVADAVIEGLDREEFMIAPHPQAIEYFQAKAHHYENWLGGMRHLQQKLDEQK